MRTVKLDENVRSPGRYPRQRATAVNQYDRIVDLRAVFDDQAVLLQRAVFPSRQRRVVDDVLVLEVVVTVAADVVVAAVAMDVVGGRVVGS